ncbi:16S rRNA (cytosine(967)-C(5))-methyltransferase RsmB [Sansalvadorimonas sp. 2012CJ34-2]|uniref:16S rRNA (cytosine(967)-C(5))-methyltransferase n=1 Tax=Parendozoicomonas callyspongiae TaxID=2942213 RepID=A0ABT0PAX4_9GAMM|nr:16S rRNA (cytosine(967)-C(5))-methyltransferase RsmB [Sansalvadorimonas sp. 2012CJ34-2]MCL6268539.1 16S rRNA (cytosine(967)-C(5))-methyltransferase RsmB [Sansalvadorimonas sp. 2012CJ34-2]
MAARKPSVRLNAAQALARVIKGESLGTALPAVEETFEGRDLALLRQLCYTTLRHWFSLNARLDALLSKPLKTKDSEVKALMLLGLCQLSHMRIPEHASISETVTAAGNLKRKPWARGLVNAVLRNSQREADTLQSLSLDNAEKCELPAWLYGKIAKAWSDQLDEVIAGTNSQAPMTLRVNARKTSREDYLQVLKEADISAETCQYSRHGIQLEQATNVSCLPGFSDGMVSVQDEAAQLSADMLECQPGNRVLDACAAPGGKTCHLLESTADLDMTALDLEAARLERVAENLERLQLQAKLVRGDASKPKYWWDDKPFDRILLDAPCSATGVIRRHPDIKLLRRPEDIVQLAELQGRILDTMWSLLKPGGTMVYATCSILPEENSKQIKSFLARTENAVQDTPIMGCGLDTGFGMQLLPTKGMHDGFFYCRLRKQP